MDRLLACALGLFVAHWVLCVLCLALLAYRPSARPQRQPWELRLLFALACTFLISYTVIGCLIFYYALLNDSVWTDKFLKLISFSIPFEVCDALPFLAGADRHSLFMLSMSLSKTHPEIRYPDASTQPAYGFLYCLSAPSCYFSTCRSHWDGRHRSWQSLFTVSGWRAGSWKLHDYWLLAFRSLLLLFFVLAWTSYI